MQTRILECLSRAVPASASAFDRRTGRFLADNGGWAVTLQDRIFPMALLFTEPGSPLRGDKQLLEWCRRGGDALRDFQDEDGRFEFIKTDGSRWGKIYQPWTIYHWVEAYALLREELGRARRQRWEDGLALAYNGLARQLATPRAHNIPTWSGMSLVRGGQLFGRDDWSEVGRRQVMFAAESQHAHGYWPEGAGPTNGYNTVYVHALGLYHAFTGDRRVLPALRRAAEYHATFVYPDGSCVETIDGRQRYHPEIRVCGWPGLMLTPVGRAVVDLWADKSLSAPAGMLSPHLASACQHAVDGPRAPLPWQAKNRILYKRSALVRTSGPWHVCVSGYSTPPGDRGPLADARWIMSRSNCLSVWHRDHGLLIGGGNSKLDPLFATFTVWEDGALRLEPDRVRFGQRDGWDEARFSYGKFACVLRFRMRSAHALDLVFRVPHKTTPQAHFRAGFTFRVAEGQKLGWQATGKPRVTGEAVVDPLRTLGFSWLPDDHHGRRTLASEGWRLDMPPESSLAYPAYPFNPYAIDGAAPPKDALGAVVTGFTTARERAFVLRIGK